MEKVAIAILIHDEVDRADTLLRTFVSFAEQTEFSNGFLPVYIFINGENENIRTVVNLLVQAYFTKFEFHIEESPVNKGCSHGVNALATMTQEYEYVLFLEGDWIMLKNTPTNWLDTCVNYLDEHRDIDQIYLRRMTSSLEVRQFYGVNYMRHITEGESFQECDMKIYTNNPVLRRNSTFFKNDILPLPEVENETKYNPDWGAAEIAHESLYPLKSVIFSRGIFVHYFPSSFELTSPHGRGISFQPVFTDNPLACEHCKFGFLCTQEPDFCKCCNKLGTTDYDKIEQEYIFNI